MRELKLFTNMRLQWLFCFFFVQYLIVDYIEHLVSLSM